jgi:uncharacterized glyoxalase superfamily protein PhnB
MAETLVPIFRVDNAREAAGWYRRLGFEVLGEHQFQPDFPVYMFLRRGDTHLHLSEHTGDAPIGSLAYFYVVDLDIIAATFNVAVNKQPWGRQLELTDPSGNRIRIGDVPNPSRTPQTRSGSR